MKPLSTAGALLLALFTAIAPVVPSAAQQPAAEPLGLYHEIHGEGEPLVLLHGAFMTIETNWASSLAKLALSRKVVAVELQGHGRTADRDGPLRYDTMADDVARLLETLGIEKAAVLGYSMGGNVALQLALRHRDRVDRIVVISAAASDKGLAAGHKDMVQHLSADMFQGTPLVAEYEKLSPRPDFPGLVDKVKQLELTSFDWTADLAKIKARTLLIAGGRDTQPPRRNAQGPRWPRQRRHQRPIKSPTARATGHHPHGHPLRPGKSRSGHRRHNGLPGSTGAAIIIEER